jgi:predicted component of type VI protein secretion system
VRDEVNGGAERELPGAAHAFALRFDGEPLDGHVALRVAEIVRAPAGGFAVAEDFAPTALCWSAAPPVARLLKRMVDICCARASELSAQRRQRTQGMVECSCTWRPPRAPIPSRCGGNSRGCAERCTPSPPTGTRATSRPTATTT